MVFALGAFVKPIALAFSFGGIKAGMGLSGGLLFCTAFGLPTGEVLVHPHLYKL